MKGTTHHRILTTAAAMALATAGTLGCTSTGTTVAGTSYVYDDGYLYTTYYPVDVAYASYYWAYPWDYTTLYYLSYGGSNNSNTNNTGAAGNSGTTNNTTGAAGNSGTATGVRSGVAAAIEALARGQQVCPGQVTVNEKTAAVVCAGGAAARAGATITFNNCATSGGTINGTVDVTGTATASDQACGASTMITLNHTSTFTNLSIKVADGRTLIIPNATNSGMTTFTFGQSPTTSNFNTDGELQILDTGGAMTIDLTFKGDNMLTFSGSQSYKIDGSTTVSEKNGSASATISRQGLVRSGGCCRPTAGSVTIDRTGGQFPGQANWSFGPSCGQVMRNGTSATMPTCM